MSVSESCSECFSVVYRVFCVVDRLPKNECRRGRGGGGGGGGEGGKDGGGPMRSHRSRTTMNDAVTTSRPSPPYFSFKGAHAEIDVPPSGKAAQQA